MAFIAAPNSGAGTSACKAENKAPPRVLFFCLTNNVGGGERMIGEMAGKGVACAVLSPPRYYCQQTQFAKRRFFLPPQCGMWLANLFAWPALEIILRIWQPDLVMPLDDIAASLLMGIAIRPRTSRDLKGLLSRSLGNARGYEAASSRASLMDVARQLGIRHPKSKSIGDTAELEDAIARIGYPVAVKREWTCGGCGVSIATDGADLRETISVAPWRTYLAKLRSHFLKQIIWSAAGQLRLPDDLIQIQGYVKGRLAVRTVAAWEGRELEGASFLAECVHPSPNGSSTVVAPLQHGEMEQATRRLIKALGCSGIVSFDFIIDEQNQAHLIEMNARPIGLSHLGRLFGRDICRALLRRLGWNAPADEASQHAPAAVVLFPKELQRDANSTWISRPGAMHDVPWKDFALIASYTGARKPGEPRKLAWPGIRAAKSVSGLRV